jgi:hypothetical protein
MRPADHAPRCFSWRSALSFLAPNDDERSRDPAPSSDFRRVEGRLAADVELKGADA